MPKIILIPALLLGFSIIFSACTPQNIPYTSSSVFNTPVPTLSADNQDSQQLLDSLDDSAWDDTLDQDLQNLESELQ